jgi:endonuclease/exonuclease/phosphatase (EEP) superfamily protein YafD
LRYWIAIILVVLAAGLATSPWTGRYSSAVDALASLLPLAPILAILAVMIGYRSGAIPIYVLACFALVASAIGMIPEFWPPSERLAQGDGPQISIVTHNLARTNGDPAKTMRVLIAADADIMLFQEADGRMKPYLDTLNQRYPFHSDCLEYSDLALYSRLPISKVKWRFRRSSGESFGPELIWARLDFPGRPPVTIATMHMPWPYPSTEQYYIRRYLTATIGRMDSRYLVLAGDFNLTPWGHAMRTLDSGLAPMRRITHGLFSFPARILGQRRRTRLLSWLPVVPVLPIDHMFVGPGWGVVSVERLPATGSDHYPLKIRLALRHAPE